MSKFFSSKPDLESAADEAIADMEAEASRASEVYFRIQKANYYLSIINSPLFPEDAPEAALEVEAEIREFADSQLRKFLGMSASETSAHVKSDAALPFDAEQVQALVMWSNRLLKRDTEIKVVQPVTEATAPRVRDAAPQPLPAPATLPTAETFRRRPGRPPGTGKHQRAAAAAAAAAQQVEHVAVPSPATIAPPASNDIPTGPGIPPNLERGSDGNLYQNVEYVKDGKVIQAKAIWQPPAKTAGPQPAPYATPQQMQNPPLPETMVVSGGLGRTAGIPPDVLNTLKNRFFK